ncbi:MAG: hypothetical protein OZ948_06800 [Deltaproteobacteria bacterium]|nr:hypothetical protein [Deltaproteobacteria bacterium]
MSAATPAVDAASAAAAALLALDAALGEALATGTVERALALGAEREARIAALVALDPQALAAPAVAAALVRSKAGLPRLVALATERRDAVGRALTRLRAGAESGRRARGAGREEPRFVSERA